MPLSDENPRLVIRYPYVTWSLIAINLAVYVLFQSGWVLAFNEQALFGFGTIPAVVFGSAYLPDGVLAAPGAATFITSQFLHGGLLHLIGNLLFIFVFADNIEDSMGHGRFLLFYLLCGTAGAALHAFAMPESEAALIGASGAVSGILAAYLLLHPRVKLWVLLFARVPMKITASWIILAWAALQALSALFSTENDVGWWAHLGGFLAGTLLIPLFKRANVPWFGRPAKTI